MSTQHELPGLETDNLLGFLALLGLLRAIGKERPSLFPRACYHGSPLRAQLFLQADLSAEEVAAVASRGCSTYSEELNFGTHRDLTFGQDDARVLLKASLARNASPGMMSALFSDGAVRTDGRIEPTPFCAMFGQGHQSFLARLQTVSLGTVPRASKSKKVVPDLNDPAILARALFALWTRSDATESFRWDFEEDRRYALRDVDPSSDPATTEHGANRLAIVGLLSFQSAPTIRRGRVVLSTRAVSRGRDRRPIITWPIWMQPASLEAIHAMLDDPELVRDYPVFASLQRYGIEQLRRVRRVMNGKYISFTRAEALTQ
jgi:hypothetical protein